MSDETIAAFDGWETQGFSGDEVHAHFEDHGSRDPCKIYREGCNLLGILTKQTIDEDSVYGQVMYGIAAQSYEGALADVADMFGLDLKQFEHTLAEWVDQSRKCKIPLSFAEFPQYHRAAQKES